MRWTRTLVVAALAMGAQADSLVSMLKENLSKRDSGAQERQLKEAAKVILRSQGYLEARQSQGTGTPGLNPDGTLDMAVWNDAADRACQDALRSLEVASNPSGACVCYNLPILNNVTGFFEADLRLYQLSEPRDQFLGIPQEKIEVELSYNGASVSEVKQQTIAGLQARQAPEDQPRADLRLLRSYMFVGQVDKDRMTPDMTPGILQSFIMPVVTLKAINNNGLVVSTNVSSNEAAFVVGEFSTQVFMSSFRQAELAIEAELEKLKNGTVAFVLPGVELMIAPWGLAITSLWLVLGLAAYGFGTYERYNFRELHRKRVAIQEKGAVPRF
ncbi:hypothetical protein VTJ83DRAFT_5162 [Remersonia thermophila]|uniref:Uncharacterized protein n=1 Tax=Remersonia thermophila TaxID=72144 RepID=A0ABR4DCR8_9PEZI